MRNTLLITTAMALAATFATQAIAQVAAAPASAGTPTEAEAAPAGLQDIIVTAQRREENLQRTAAALAVIGEEELGRARIGQPTELQTLTPSLQAQNNGAFTNFFIRGVGAATANGYSEPGVAVNYDGVYISRATSTQGLFYDLARVEILKGPQGTLYGRNATGGAVNVIPKAAKIGETSGFATAEVGNYSLKRFEAAVNAPLGESAAVRIATQIVDRDGYLKDGTDDDVGQAFRINFIAQPSADITLRLGADYYHRGGNGGGGSYVSQADPVLSGGQVVGYTFSEVNLPKNAGTVSTLGNALLTSRQLSTSRTFAPGLQHVEFADNEFYGFNAQLDWRTSLGTLTILPAYRHSKLDQAQQALGYWNNTDEIDKQTSLEARLTSDNDGPIRYILGGYYIKEKIDAAYTFNTLAVAANQIFKTGTESVAAFGRLTWEITPGLRLNGGLRYTEEKKFMRGDGFVAIALCVVPGTAPCPGNYTLPNFTKPGDLGFTSRPYFPRLVPGTGTLLIPVNNSVNGNLKDSAVTWRAAVEWDVGPKSLLYASYETGFRAGGFFFTIDDPTFKPERIRAFTLGSKNRFFDNRLQLNLEAFYWKYNDQQLSHPSSDSSGALIFRTENVGKSTNKGAEVEVQYLLTENTVLRGGAQYLHARLNEFLFSAPNQGVPPLIGCPTVGVGATYVVDCSGRKPQKAPTWTLNFGAEQTIPLASGARFILNVDTRYQTETLAGIDYLPNEVVGSYWRSNASVKYASVEDRWSLTAYISNIENNRVATNTGIHANAALFTSSFLPPRTYGLRASFNF